MKKELNGNATCPICGKTYSERPALSRVDNCTEICPECGTRQALECLGVDRDEQERIIKRIYNYS